MCMLNSPVTEFDSVLKHAVKKVTPPVRARKGEEKKRVVVSNVDRAGAFMQLLVCMTY
jgi:hypothetical protein